MLDASVNIVIEVFFGKIKTVIRIASNSALKAEGKNLEPPENIMGKLGTDVDKIPKPAQLDEGLLLNAPSV